MTGPSGSAFRLRILFALALLCLCCSLPLHAQDSLPECSLSKTNRSCKLVIDRSNPVAPSTVQMYSNEQLTVIIKNPLPFERYFLDFTTGQAAVTPDVMSSIIQGLIPDLQKLEATGDQALKVMGEASTNAVAACEANEFSDPTWPPSGQVKAGRPKFDVCFGELAKLALATYKDLEPLVAPDSLISTSLPQEPQYYRGPKRNEILDDINTYLQAESNVSNKITALSKAPSALQPTTSAPKAPPPVYTADDEITITELGDVQKITDAISADLSGYYQRIEDIGICNYGFIATSLCDCATPIPEISIQSREDSEQIYKNMVTRTITYSVDSLNLVSYSQQAAPNPTNKKALATVAIAFADHPNEHKILGFPFTALRWEASAGVFFSTLPNRSFSVAPIYTGTMVTDNKINVSAPGLTPLPFAAANYRLTDDLPGRWKSNVYWTAGIGINPNTTTAEYATGFSYAWRATMISALCHFGHGSHLTQGFTPTTDLGPSFTGTLPTKYYWRGAFAFGVSVRVPSLTGR
jgi:hypothetical protein